jgi:hypothetical protein
MNEKGLGYSQLTSAHLWIELHVPNKEVRRDMKENKITTRLEPRIGFCIVLTDAQNYLEKTLTRECADARQSHERA